MKVTFTTSISTVSGSFGDGETHDVPEAHGLAWIKAGTAVRVAESAPVTKIESDKVTAPFTPSPEGNPQASKSKTKSSKK